MPTCEDEMIARRPAEACPDAASSGGFKRPLLIGGGVLLIIASPFVGLIPGPGGTLVFAAGLALILRGSSRAKRHYVRFKRRWPRPGGWADWGLRRGSARRRRRIARELGDRSSGKMPCAAPDREESVDGVGA